MLRMKNLAILFALFYIVGCRADELDDDYPYPLAVDGEELPNQGSQNEGDDDDEIVAISSRPRKLIVSENSNVTFPCQLNSTDVVAITRLWSSEDGILFQDAVKFTKNPHFELLRDGSLLIKRVEKSNQGSYKCSIAVPKEPSVVHTLKVITPNPEIDEFLTASNQTTFEVGQKLSLSCKAFGNPSPTISWYKILDGNKKEPLPATGEKYEIDGLKVENSGVYQCIADNRSGKPASAEIGIDVASCKPSTSNQDYDYPLDDDTEMQNDNEQDPNYYEDNNDDTSDEPAEIFDDKPVGILSKSQKIITLVGNDVLLPCQPNSTEGVIVWFNSSTMLFQSGIAINGPDHMKQLPNGSLIIHGIRKDEGDTYVCKDMVSSKNTPELKHYVRVLSSPAPVIDEIIAERELLKVGDSLQLKCVAVGDPAPNISWHKTGPGNTMERLSSGERLLIENVKHRDGGNYTCLADNKILPLAMRRIQIKVEMKPIISIEQIYSDSGSHLVAELKCLVHAEPPASVVWMRNGERLISRDHIQIKSEGHVHKLFINNPSDKDFTTYVCAATNPIGKSKKEIKLTKTPTLLKFMKSEDGAKDIELTWELQSKAPISEHEIHYKKKEAEEWERVNPEVKKPGENDVYIVKHLLKGLEPGLYEAKIRSKNTHGWSEFSDPMSFQRVNAKHGHHNKHNKKPHKEPKEKHIISSSESPKVMETDKSMPGDHNPSESAKTAASQPSSGAILGIFGVVPLFCVSLLARL